MATNLVAKKGQNYLPPALIALPIQNRIGYRDHNMRVNSANDASISCKILVKIGPADPEILWLRANESGTKQNWLSWQRPLTNWKTRYRLIICT